LFLKQTKTKQKKQQTKTKTKKKEKKRKEKEKKKKKKTRSTDGSPSQRPYHYERRWQGDWWWKSLLHYLPCSPSSYSSTLNYSPHPPCNFWCCLNPINVSPGRLPFLVLLPKTF